MSVYAREYLVGENFVLVQESCFMGLNKICLVNH